MHPISTLCFLGTNIPCDTHIQTRQMTMPTKIEVYGTTTCSKCVSVREFLDTKNIKYTAYMIDLMPLEKDEMIQRTGLKYYPQIFINGKYIGGEEELLMLDYEGKLQALLAVSFNLTHDSTTA